MTRFLFLGAALAALSACTPPTPEQAAARCEERARAAQAPDIGITLGVNSDSGPYAGGRISVSGDYIAGRDPMDVYEDCVMRLTGAEPVRPPALRY